MFDFLKYGSNIAVISDKGEVISYQQLHKETSTSMKRGLVFCLCNNDLPSLLCYLTCLQNRLPIVMLDRTKPKDMIDSLVSVYKPEYIWDGSFKETGFKEGYINDDIALCLTTSGSTGSPKLVKLSERNIISNAESIAAYLNITEQDRPVTSLPMYYSFGLSVINSHLVSGATILLTEKTYAQREFWNFIKENKATSLSGVPYTFEILKRLRFFRMDLPYLKILTQAGGKLHADLAKEYVNFAVQTGKKFYIMYGQTEATARMSYLPWKDAINKYTSIGIAIPGGKFSIIDPDGNPITTPETDGELVYTGPNVSFGYAECREDLAVGDVNHGVLHTGDIARMDYDGFYYITGRLKRFVKIWGNRCNLDAVEQLIKSISINCACVGVDDKITIFVTQLGLENSILKLLTTKTGLNVKAFDIKVITEIPKSTSGKTQYPELQKLV